MATPIAIVAYLALFVSVGFLFLFVNLLVGYLLRPADPHAEKLEIYECGEPTIGSSFVQFDLRFYVVALLFIIFDVEVAFFFPWATVFGKATHLMDPDFVKVTATGELSPGAEGLYQELGVAHPTIANTIGQSPGASPASVSQAIDSAAHQLAWLSVIDILVFFAVLMVGFAYVWKRGDLDWVRAISRERAIPSPRRMDGDVMEEEPLLSA